MAYATGTIAGTYRTSIGDELAVGYVVIEPSELVIRDAAGGVVLVGPRTVELVDGAFAVDVVATDDTTISPSGVTYAVTARLGSYGLRTVTGIAVGTGETVHVQ